MERRWKLKKYGVAAFFLVILLSMGSLSIGGEFPGASGTALKSALYHLQVAAGLKPSTVIVPDDTADIQAAINTLPVEGGTVCIRAGVHTLTAGLHINRSNVNIVGEVGTILRLADDVNHPVILVGTDAEVPQAQDRIENIRISYLEIDGNRANQTSELMPGKTWIRNNGIDIRTVSHLSISHCNIHGARSGAVVASWDSEDIQISNGYFSDNHFDGIALYASRNIVISDFVCRGNLAAGISLDNDLEDVLFNNGLVMENGKVGIFVRNSSDIHFANLTVQDSQEHGAFISHESLGTQTGVTRLFFSGCSFLDNAQYGLYMGSTTAESPNNTIVSCLFSGNTNGCISDDASALHTAGNVCH